MAKYKFLKVDDSAPVVSFQFRPARFKAPAPGNPFSSRQTYDGVILYTVRIGKALYGPFSTGIRTFRSIYNSLDQIKVAEVRELTGQLENFIGIVEYAHRELVKHDSPIDARSIASSVEWVRERGRVSATAEGVAPYAPVTLTRLNREFMESRKALIVADRTKRRLDQISPATYQTYPKRWVLIQGYLAYNRGRADLVINVKHEFASGLKRWLTNQQQANGKPYDIATINKVISYLKMLMTHAVDRGYIEQSPIQDFACRGGSPANPKPLTQSQMQHLETCGLPPQLRHVCDSWIVAAELCLHYSDYMELPKMKFLQRPRKNGPGIQRYIQHSRAKQTGSNLMQTVNITPRAERILARWGVDGLYYRHSALFSKYLKQIATLADLRDENGDLIGLQFGQGRDTGLTSRAEAGANNIQLAKIGGWTRGQYADRYIGNALNIVENFIENQLETA